MSASSKGKHQSSLLRFMPSAAPSLKRKESTQTTGSADEEKMAGLDSADLDDGDLEIDVDGADSALSSESSCSSSSSESATKKSKSSRSFQKAWKSDFKWLLPVEDSAGNVIALECDTCKVCAEFQVVDFSNL